MVESRVRRTRAHVPGRTSACASLVWQPVHSPNTQSIGYNQGPGRSKFCSPPRPCQVGSFKSRIYAMWPVAERTVMASRNFSGRANPLRRPEAWPRDNPDGTDEFAKTKLHLWRYESTQSRRWSLDWCTTNKANNTRSRGLICPML